MPVERSMQIVELKKVLQEKEILQTELHNTQSIVGTIRDEKETLENQIKALKEKFDNMTTIDPSLYLALELGSLLVKELELKNAQEELAEVKKSLAHKIKILIKTSTKNENLRRQFEAGKQALKDTKLLLWIKCSKKLRILRTI